MKDDFRCNVLIMGKTGTGKSTLLNYLCDKKLAETGAGKPVTGEGIYEYTAIMNDQEVQIYDSWGIEAGKVDRWKSLIDDSLKQHGVDKSIEDWFHSVIYCIQAGGGRVEDVDAEIIRKFLSEGYLITVVLTKADQINEIDETKMKSVILNEIQGATKNRNSKAFKIISTCAEKKKTRSGETQPFGKEEVQKAILEGWRDTIVERLPKHVVSRLCAIVDEWAANEGASLAKANISGLRDENSSLYMSIEKHAKDLCEEISQEHFKRVLTEAVESCRKANAALQATFDIDNSIISNIPDFHRAWWERLLTLPVAIPRAIIRFFKSISDKCITEERQNIIQYINDNARKVKKEVEKLENIVAIELIGIL